MIIEAIICSFFLLASEGLVHIADCLFTHICHSFPIPATIYEDLLERIVQEVLVRWYGTFSYPTIQESAKVGIGFLIDEIWKVKYWKPPRTRLSTFVVLSQLSQLCETGREASKRELVWTGEHFSLLTPPPYF